MILHLDLAAGIGLGSFVTLHDSTLMQHRTTSLLAGLVELHKSLHILGMIYGYARVSTDGQSTAAQVVELKAASAAVVFAEKGSGAKRERKQLNKVLSKLASGDVLVVTRLDRLARNTRDLLNIVSQIDAVGARLESINDKWADRRTAHGRLMMTVLAGLAEFERELIKDRTGAGRTRAKKDGVKFGPKFKLDRHQRAEALNRKDAGEPLSMIARSYRVSKSTISRLQP